MYTIYFIFYRNIRDFVYAQKDQIKFFNTLHSYSQLILLPYGFTSNTDIVPGYDKIYNLATKVNDFNTIAGAETLELPIKGCVNKNV